MGFEDVAELHSTVRGTKKNRKEKKSQGEGRDPSNELCRLLGIPAAR